ncbi:MAG: hypothetical protein ACE5LU_09225 [Anaerolineae bacterium]
MRRVSALAVIAFTVTLGIVVGNRLSTEAMAVVVGIVCGVLASVPTSILLLILVRRLTTEPSQPPQHHQQTAYPPVIVISPGAGQSDRSPDYLFDPPTSRPAGYLPRDFRIVGEEDEEEDW